MQKKFQKSDKCNCLLVVKKSKMVAFVFFEVGVRGKMMPLHILIPDLSQFAPQSLLWPTYAS